MREYENRKGWLARAARLSHLTYRQVYALYYGQCRDPKISVALRVLTAADRARQEANQLAEKFEAMAGSLHANDANFYGEDVLALVNAARALRGLAHTGKVRAHTHPKDPPD